MSVPGLALCLAFNKRGFVITFNMMTAILWNLPCHHLQPHPPAVLPWISKIPHPTDKIPSPAVLFSPHFYVLLSPISLLLECSNSRFQPKETPKTGLGVPPLGACDSSVGHSFCHRLISLGLPDLKVWAGVISSSLSGSYKPTEETLTSIDWIITELFA